jgi:hypothetical protein
MLSACNIDQTRRLYVRVSTSDRGQSVENELAGGRYAAWMDRGGR